MELTKAQWDGIEPMIVSARRRYKSGAAVPNVIPTRHSSTVGLLREKRGLALGNTKRGKGIKIMAVADASGLPIAAHVESPSPHEVKLAVATLAKRFIPSSPQRLIGDKAYEFDALDRQLESQFGMEMIAPHRSNRKAPQNQDGRPLRRHKRRWKIERLFAWLYNFRRLVVRYEYHAANFLGLVHLGCAVILLRQFCDDFHKVTSKGEFA